MPTRTLDLRRQVLAHNDGLAASLRARFDAAGLLAVNLVSSPGTGKTALLEVTMTRLRQRGFSVGALVGDLATENDALRLARSGALVRQIETGEMCHLEASMIEQNLADWPLHELDFLFIENVGNLVCPAGYDLGEQLRIVLLSVTEGEDKPRKYPPMFHSADVAVITKIDLAGAVEFDQAAAFASLEAVHPGIPVYETSAKSGAGMDNWLELLERTQELQR